MFHKFKKIFFVSDFFLDNIIYCWIYFENIPNFGKNEIFVNNWNFCRKSTFLKFLSKIDIFEISVRNVLSPNFVNLDFGQKFRKCRFWTEISKMSILDRNFQNVDFGPKFRKRRFWTEISKMSILDRNFENVAFGQKFRKCRLGCSN